MKKYFFLTVLTLFTMKICAQVITGKIIDSKSYGLKGLQVKLYMTPNVYSVITGNDGSFTFNNLSDVEEEELPYGYSVSGNYPNPFNPTTRININLPSSDNIRVDVYNILGQLVHQIEERYYSSGTNFIDIKLDGLPNGIYLAKIFIGNRYDVTRKLLLLYGSQHLVSTGSSPHTNFSNSRLLKKTLSTKIDSLVIQGDYINKKTFTNLPPIVGAVLNLGSLTVEYIKSGQPCSGIPTVTYSGKTYNTVQIGSQCWLKENLDVGEMIFGKQSQSNDGKIEKYCYSDKLANCEKYGGLYQWNEAMSYSTQAGTRGICPSGWHIPKQEEWAVLKSFVNSNSNALKNVNSGTGSGTGTNSSGFSALLAGERFDDGDFRNVDQDAYFYSSIEASSSSVYYVDLYYSNSTIVLNNISNNKIYGFSIRCIKDDQSTQTLNAPILDSPKKGLRNILTTINLVWNSVLSATSYSLQVSTDSLFANLFINNSGITSTTYQLSNLQNSTTYYWRVKASNNSGNSDWSAVSNFTVADAVKDIGTNGGKVEVTNSSSAIKGAYIQIPSGSLSSAVKVVISEANFKPQNEDDAIVVKFEPDGLEFNTPVKIGLPYNPSISDPSRLRAFYYNKDSLSISELKVDSVDIDNHRIITTTTHFSEFYSGDHSVWANIEMLNIEGKFGAKVEVYGIARDWVTNLGLFGVPLSLDFMIQNQMKLISAGQACEEYINAYGLKLNSIFGLDLYQENFGKDTRVASCYLFVQQNSRTSINDDVEQKLTIYKSLGKNNYTKKLETDWIKDKDTRQQLYGGYPLVFKFDSFTPEAGKKYYVKLKWALAVHPDADFIARLTPIYEFSNSDDSKLLSLVQTYYDDSNNNFVDDWFEPYVVTPKPFPPILVTPGNGDINQPTSLTLNWDASSGATSYTLQVSTSSTFGSFVYNQNGLTNTNQQITGLSYSTKYYWRVSAANSTGTSDWSDTWNFTTMNATALQAPTLVSPSNNSTNQSTSPTLQWNASNGAASYTLHVSTTNSFGSLVFNQSGLTNTSQQINGLNNNTTYYWRVNAANSFGTSGWSSVWSFTTTSGSISGGVPCPGTPTVTYAGKTYNTVQIGTQCWLKENLDVGTMIQSNKEQTNNGTIEKYCYDNDANKCTTYGGLYEWAEAVQYKNGATNTTQPNPEFIGNVQGICPSGWHIPNKEEFETLQISTVVNSNSNALKAIGQGTVTGVGTNTSGFSALLAGCGYYNGAFAKLGIGAWFWNSTFGGGEYALNMCLWGSDAYVYMVVNDKPSGFSVRCVKD